MTSIKLIVGLGNPGSEYRGTRHNAGADFVEELARQCGSALQADSKFFGMAGRVNLSGHDLRLLIPTTFMNRSGKAVAALAQFYKMRPMKSWSPTTNWTFRRVARVSNRVADTADTMACAT